MKMDTVINKEAKIIANRISWWRTDFGQAEIDNLREAICKEMVSQGSLTEKFEKEIARNLGVPFAVVTTSGSVSLLMSLLAIGIKAGDEVIVPNRTWIATAHAVLFAGAKVVLVDVEKDIPLIDAKQIRKKITSKTKAIIPVHLNGRSVEMETIEQIAKQYNLKIIEDACQAFYSKNKHGFLGTQSILGCFSLGVTKLISTGQGGVIVTKDQEFYEKLKLLRNHGVVDNFTDTWNQLGFNFKFTDLLAAVGLAQINRVKDRVEHVLELYKRYAEALEDLSFLKLIPVDFVEGEIPLYVEAISPVREKLCQFLNSSGIQCRPLPPNLDISGYIPNDHRFPNSKLFAEQGFYLPCGPAQPLATVEIVRKALKSFR